MAWLESMALKLDPSRDWTAGACFLAFLYVVWPYYTTFWELATAVRSGDSATISELVDWERLRTSFKAQLRARIQPFGEDTTEPFEFLGGVLGLAIGDRLIDSMIDRTVTPQGLANLLKEKPANYKPPNFFGSVKFAFFVSPIHFRLDLGDPDLSMTLMFKGTGWQVIDVTLPGQVADAPPAAHSPPGTILQDKGALQLAAQTASSQNLSDAPFGLTWGMSAEQARDAGVVLKDTTVRSFGITYQATNLAKIISDAEVVYTAFGYDNKLSHIAAFGKDFKNDPYGSAVKRRYDELSSALSEKYGKGKQSHFAAHLYEGNDFIMGIEKGENWWYTDFDNGTVYVELKISASDLSTSYWAMFFNNKTLQDKDALSSSQNLSDAPFGLTWGMSAEQARDAGVVLKDTTIRGFGITYQVTNLAKIISDAEQVMMSFGYDNKLWRIAAFGKYFKNDPYGSAVKRRYDELSSALSEKYGKGKQSHFTANLYEGSDFIKGIKNGENSWYTDFDNGTFDVELKVSASDLSTSYWAMFFNNKMLRSAFERAKIDEDDIIHAAYAKGDYVTLLRIYQAQANRGNANAQYMLGLMYEEGRRGVPRDYGEAAKWYRKAADQGHSEAQRNLAVMYREGRGVPQDSAGGGKMGSKGGRLSIGVQF
jgi:hypothetical protein